MCSLYLALKSDDVADILHREPKPEQLLKNWDDLVLETPAALFVCFLHAVK